MNASANSKVDSFLAPDERKGVRLDDDPQLPVIPDQTRARQRADWFRIG